VKPENFIEVREDVEPVADPASVKQVILGQAASEWLPLIPEPQRRNGSVSPVLFGFAFRPISDPLPLGQINHLGRRISEHVAVRAAIQAIKDRIIVAPELHPKALAATLFASAAELRAERTAGLYRYA